MTKRVPKVIHNYYSKLGKKSAEMRAKRLLEQINQLSTDKDLQEKPTNNKLELKVAGSPDIASKT